MKTSILLVSVMLIASVAFGQNNLGNEVVVVAPFYQTDIYTSVDDFLSKNVEYTSVLENSGIEGTEVIQFVVTANGNLTNFNVLNSVSPNLDEHIIQTLKITSGKWNPAIVDGKPVSMEKEVSITFYLHSEQDLIKSAKHYHEKGNEWLFVKGNPKKALRFYKQGTMLLPNEESILVMRSYCKYLLGDNEGAVHDWERLKILASRNGDVSEKYLATQNLNWYYTKIDSILVNQGKK